MYRWVSVFDPEYKHEVGDRFGNTAGDSSTGDAEDNSAEHGSTGDGEAFVDSKERRNVDGDKGVTVRKRAERRQRQREKRAASRGRKSEKDIGDTELGAGIGLASGKGKGIGESFKSNRPGSTCNPDDNSLGSIVEESRRSIASSIPRPAASGPADSLSMSSKVISSSPGATSSKSTTPGSKSSRSSPQMFWSPFGLGRPPGILMPYFEVSACGVNKSLDSEFEIVEDTKRFMRACTAGASQDSSPCWAGVPGVAGGCVAEIAAPQVYSEIGIQTDVFESVDSGFQNKRMVRAQEMASELFWKAEKLEKSILSIRHQHPRLGEGAMTPFEQNQFGESTFDLGRSIQGSFRDVWMRLSVMKNDGCLLQNLMLRISFVAGGGGSQRPIRRRCSKSLSATCRSPSTRWHRAPIQQ